MWQPLALRLLRPLVVGLAWAGVLFFHLVSRAQNLPEEGPKSNDLQFVLTRYTEEFKIGETNRFSLVMHSFQKDIRPIKEIPTALNSLTHSPALEFVFHFGDGTIIVAPNPERGDRDPKTKIRPLTIPGDGQTAAGFDLTRVMNAHPDLIPTFDKCKDFAVTIIVKDLKLQSNPVAFNGFKPPATGLDGLADYKTYHDRKKDSLKPKP
jgi:hypothetical protein